MQPPQPLSAGAPNRARAGEEQRPAEAPRRESSPPGGTTMFEHSATTVPMPRSRALARLMATQRLYRVSYLMIE